MNLEILIQDYIANEIFIPQRSIVIFTKIFMNWTSRLNFKCYELGDRVSKLHLFQLLARCAAST